MLVGNVIDGRLVYKKSAIVANRVSVGVNMIMDLCGLSAFVAYFVKVIVIMLMLGIFGLIGIIIRIQFFVADVALTVIVFI